VRRVGLAGVALAVGCFGGVAVREVVFPARAASGTTYTYRIIDRAKLEPEEAGINRMALGGWRLVAASSAYDYFEHVAGSDGAPSATSAPAPLSLNAP
jgi:hypothetical protein